MASGPISHRALSDQFSGTLGALTQQEEYEPRFHGGWIQQRQKLDVCNLSLLLSLSPRWFNKRTLTIPETTACKVYQKTKAV